MVQTKVGDLVTVIPLDHSTIGVNNCRRVYEQYPIPDAWDPPRWVEQNAIGIVLDSTNLYRKVVFGGRVVWIHKSDIERHR